MNETSNETALNPADSWLDKLYGLQQKDENKLADINDKLFNTSDEIASVEDRLQKLKFVQADYYRQQRVIKDGTNEKVFQHAVDELLKISDEWQERHSDEAYAIYDASHTYLGNAEGYVEPKHLRFNQLVDIRQRMIINGLEGKTQYVVVRKEDGTLKSISIPVTNISVGLNMKNIGAERMSLAFGSADTYEVNFNGELEQSMNEDTQIVDDGIRLVKLKPEEKIYVVESVSEIPELNEDIVLKLIDNRSVKKAVGYLLANKHFGGQFDDQKVVEAVEKIVRVGEVLSPALIELVLIFSGIQSAATPDEL